MVGGFELSGYRSVQCFHRWSSWHYCNMCLQWSCQCRRHCPVESCCQPCEHSSSTKPSPVPPVRPAPFCTPHQHDSVPEQTTGRKPLRSDAFSALRAWPDSTCCNTRSAPSPETAQRGHPLFPHVILVEAYCECVKVPEASARGGKFLNLRYFGCVEVPEVR